MNLFSIVSRGSWLEGQGNVKKRPVKGFFSYLVELFVDISFRREREPSRLGLGLVLSDDFVSVLELLTTTTATHPNPYPTPRNCLEKLQSA
jgi:hypothetical protein